MSTFWSDVLESSELLDLTDENNFVKRLPKRYKVYQTPSGRTLDNADSFINADSEATTVHVRNSNSKKYDSRTVGEMDLINSESKENDTIDIRLSDSSENRTDGAQESAKSEKHKVFVKDNLNSSVNHRNNIGSEGEQSVIINDKSHKSELNDLDVNNICKSETSEVTLDSSLSIENKSTTNIDVSSVTLVEETSVSKNENNESDSSTALLNLNVKERASFQSGEVKCDEQEKLFTAAKLESEVKESMAESATVISQESQPGALENNNETVAEGESKTPEEIALAEEERLKEAERLRVAKEKLEAEERLKKEAEEKKRLEEEKIRTIEEAKKIEKQMKEAEFYEAMLREEEKKKKVFIWDETPASKTKNPNKCTLKIDAEDLELFCLGRENGTHDYIGQRILQVKFNNLFNYVNNLVFFIFDSVFFRLCVD